MDKIVISDIPPYDGQYEIDLSYFTNRELHEIKRLAGVRAGELEDALAASDTDVIVAIAVIALKRNGKQVEEDLIWDAPAGGISLEVEEEAEEGPPETPSPESDENESSGGSETSSGDALTSISEIRANHQSLTGSPGSATSAISVLETSAS